ncbi:MAG: hypothetical protein WC661_09165 [Opitutaceae bacterium]|jgi:hypothetical protein
MTTPEKKEFLARIEFHGETASTLYEGLNDLMAEGGFSRTITSAEPATYYLPTAEYFIETELNRDEVIAAAMRIANKLKRKYSIIVSESKGITWGGLTKREE